MVDEYPKFDLGLLKLGLFLLVRHDRKPGIKNWVGNEIYKSQLQAGFTAAHAAYTHVAPIGRAPYIIEAALPKIKPLNIMRKYRGKFVRIVKYKGDKYDDYRHEVAWWAATHCNLRYDIPGVFRFNLRWLFPQSRSWYFCSENAGWALQREYHRAFNGRAPEDIMPADFLNPREFEIVWEGIIS